MSWMLTPAVVLGFLLITLYLGIRAGSGRQRSVSEHVVAGRGLPLVLVFFIAVGEIYSSLSFLGQPGWSYAYGVPIRQEIERPTLFHIDRSRHHLGRYSILCRPGTESHRSSDQADGFSTAIPLLPYTSMPVRPGCSAATWRAMSWMYCPG